MNNLKATIRENTTTGQTKKLRTDGFIPAILYGGKNPNTKISIDKKSIRSILNSESFLSKVIELDINGKKISGVAEGLHARVIQHEFDHLNGVLYTSRLAHKSAFGYSDEIEKIWKNNNE